MQQRLSSTKPARIPIFCFALGRDAVEYQPSKPVELLSDWENHVVAVLLYHVLLENKLEHFQVQLLVLGDADADLILLL